MHVKDSDGFSLVELVVTLGISGLTTILFLRYSLNSQNQDRNARFLATINETMSTVNYALTKPETCTSYFQGLEVPTAAGASINLTANSRTLLETGTYQDFAISSIQLANSALSNSSFDLVIQFTPRTTTAFNKYFSPSNSVITKRISIVGVFQTGPKRVKSCGPIISDTNATAYEVFCKSMAPLTNWTAPNGPCNYNNAAFTCPPGKVPRYFNSSGFNCDWFANKYDLNNLFDFRIVNCSTKSYSFYQSKENLPALGPNNPYKKIAIGCPPDPSKMGDMNLNP